MNTAVSTGRKPWAWPFVAEGPVFVGVAVSPWGAEAAAWSFIGAFWLALGIWVLQTTIENVAAANRHFSVGVFVSTLALTALTGAIIGGGFAPPIKADTFNTVAQIDAAVLIAVMLSPGIPPAWNRTAKDAWTWALVVTTSVVIGIAAAVFGGITASRDPVPKWFNADALDASIDGLQLVPSTVLLGMSAIPIFLGTMSLAYRTYARAVTEL